jgi:hypothetical protein
VAAAFAATDAFLAVHGTGNVLEFVKFHGGSSEAPHPFDRAQDKPAAQSGMRLGLFWVN